MSRTATRLMKQFCSVSAAALSLSACTSAVVVDSEFPAPLVDPINVSVGLFFEPELRDFIHAEALPRSSTWTIDLGDANMAMLTPLFSSMFSTTSELADLPPSATDAARLDAVLTSDMEQFQFDVPPTRRDEFVEVWLEYRLQLLDGEEVVIEWFAPGYGKAEIEGDKEEAVHRAAIIAMREAGARISTEFTDQPEVKDWLARQ